MTEDMLIAERRELREARDELRAENARLRAALEELQKPQGHREERVAEWLRERGYTVTKHIQVGPPHDR